MKGVNINASRELLERLARLGVRDFVVCAGARNSPLVVVLEKSKDESSGTGGEARVHSFFEERSAAYFALGRARRDAVPTAVITTSGTAAAQLLPAAIEAFHTGVPLILMTADRPRRLRGTGAPQAIDQTGLFAKFVEMEIDFEAGEDPAMRISKWRRRGPLHINICFDEPLVDETPRAFTWPDSPMSANGDTKEDAGTGASAFPFAQTPDIAARVREFLARTRRPVAIVGTLTTEAERTAVENILLATGLPVYLEGTSGLRERPSLATQALRSGDRILSWALRNGEMDGVLRFGGIPTVRVWRDLDDPRCPASVLSVSQWPFPGLSRGELVIGDVGAVTWSADGSANLSDNGGGRRDVLVARDREARAHLEACLEREPRSEAALVRALSRSLPHDVLTYVGNSLPIREWDLVASHHAERWVRANRGVNGIDGQLSTFLGLLPEGGEGWCLTGDLTTLYDLTAPWALAAGPGLEKDKVRFVVINNGGGKIFSRLFGGALFENRHELGFASWAAMWGLHHEVWSNVPSTWEGPNRAVIEVRPEEAASERFWSACDAYWERR